MSLDRCAAQTFRRRRCRNRRMDADPLFCHRHSRDHAYERCGAVDPRSGRHCQRRAVEDGEPCAGHMPRPIDPRLESASGPYAYLSGTETGRFRG